VATGLDTRQTVGDSLFHRIRADANSNSVDSESRTVGDSLLLRTLPGARIVRRDAQLGFVATLRGTPLGLLKAKFA
jgi:hypothetical protein